MLYNYKQADQKWRVSWGQLRGALRNSHQSKRNSRLSSEDTLKSMNKRRNPQTEIMDKELEEIENKADNQRMTADLEKQQATYKQEVTNVKVPYMAT